MPRVEKKNSKPAALKPKAAAPDKTEGWIQGLNPGHMAGIGEKTPRVKVTRGESGG